MNITPTQLAKRIEKWGNELSALGIAHWEITSVTVDAESPVGNTDAKATVYVHGYYDSCSFFFQEDELARMDARELDITIIHEWVHVAMRDHDELVDDLESWLPANVWQDIQNRFRHEREGLVMRLATAMHDLYSEN